MTQKTDSLTCDGSCLGLVFIDDRVTQVTQVLQTTLHV